MFLVRGFFLTVGILALSAVRCVGAQADLIDTSILVLDPDARAMPDLPITVIDSLDHRRVDARTNAAGIARVRLVGRAGRVSVPGFEDANLQFSAGARDQTQWAVAALVVARLDDPRHDEEFTVRLGKGKARIGSLARIVHIATGVTQVGRVEAGSVVRFVGPLRGAYCLMLPSGKGERSFVVTIHPSDRGLVLQE